MLSDRCPSTEGLFIGSSATEAVALLLHIVTSYSTEGGRYQLGALLLTAPLVAVLIQ